MGVQVLTAECMVDLATAWFEKPTLPRAVAAQIECALDDLEEGLWIQGSIERLTVDVRDRLDAENKGSASRSNRRAAMRRHARELFELVAEDIREEEPVRLLAFEAHLVINLGSVLAELIEASERCYPCLHRPLLRQLVGRKDLARAIKMRQPWNAFILDMMSCYRCATGAAPTAWRDPIKGVYQSSFLNGLTEIYDALPTDSRPPLSTIGSRVEAFLKDERKGLIVFGAPITEEPHG